MSYIEIPFRDNYVPVGFSSWVHRNIEETQGTIGEIMTLLEKDELELALDSYRKNLSHIAFHRNI